MNKKDRIVYTVKGISSYGTRIRLANRIVYTVKGISSYGTRIRLANPIHGEKDIDTKIDGVKILKYGSGLLYQLDKMNNKQKIDNNITKKEKNIQYREESMMLGNSEVRIPAMKGGVFHEDKKKGVNKKKGEKDK